MKVVLIPGMDGTGGLFSPLLDELPSDIETQIICLNELTNIAPTEQALEIATLIGNDEVIILSESYSGFITYHLSLLPNINIKHIIFAASFLENPTWLSRLNKALPLNLVRTGLIPSTFLSTLLFGQRNNTRLVGLFLSCLKSVSNSTLRLRISTVANLVRPKKLMSIPCTYVQANKDYLVSNRSSDAFKELCVDLRIIRAGGGHFIVQSNPSLFSKLIQDVIAL